MSQWHVVHVTRDKYGFPWARREKCETEDQARALANSLSKEEGELWIEEVREGRNRVTYTDPNPPSPPMTREHLAELRAQVKALASKMKMP